MTPLQVVFYATVQPSGHRFSVPVQVARLFGKKFNDAITLVIERRGQTACCNKMSSGFEVVATQDDPVLWNLLKPGSRIKVTATP